MFLCFLHKRQAFHLAAFILWIEHFLLVPDPGEWPAPPLIFRPKETDPAPFPPPPPSLSQSLEDRAPTLSEGLDPLLSVNRSSTGREQSEVEKVNIAVIL